jgi:PTH1 family peptidyl-tRNA hydrolase
MNTKLIIGLGNFPTEYKNTRHNLGFIILDKIADHFHSPNFIQMSKFKSLVSEFKLGNDTIILSKPTTFMNLSGVAASLIANFYKIDKILIIHDDIDLPLGKIKLVKSTSSGGHNGIKSINNYISNYWKIKIGIGKDNNNISNFVLSSFTEEEMNIVNKSANKIIKNLDKIFTFEEKTILDINSIINI